MRKAAAECRWTLAQVLLAGTADAEMIMAGAAGAQMISINVNIF